VEGHEDQAIHQKLIRAMQNKVLSSLRAQLILLIMLRIG
jgi:hypothetical protein